MGSHWRWLGYSSAKHFEDTVMSGFIGQVEVMVRYIEKADLVDALKMHDWAAFARGYNGPRFREFKYDTKLARAYERASNGQIGRSRNAGFLRMGSRGAQVREIQALLNRAGANIVVDGDFGPMTKKAVKAFQAEHKLMVDGIVGPKTMGELAKYKTTPEEEVGEQKALDTPEVVKGTATTGVGLVITSATDKIQDIANQLSATTGVGFVDTAVTTLQVIAGFLLVAGVAYAAYGIWKKNQTETGDENV